MMKMLLPLFAVLSGVSAESLIRAAEIHAHGVALQTREDEAELDAEDGDEDDDEAAAPIPAAPMNT